MSVAAVRTSDVASRPTVGIKRLAQSAVAVSVGLYAFALAVRLFVVGLVSFPLSEGSAYYIAVARNVATGRGLVIDAIWSYTTPPLTLPRPAFELWQPMASFVAALPMAFFGTTFNAAQFGGVVLGSLLAPLAWLVARDTARRLDLPEGRAWFVPLGAGLLSAIAGPFLLATAAPDSTLPFTVLGVAACAVMTLAVAGKRRGLVALGVLLGLAYLTRLEAAWLGLAFGVLVVAVRRDWRRLFTTVAPVAGIAALVAAPWWLRNLTVFGAAFPGQVADNVFLTRNEQIYAYADRPTLDGFLGQGLPQIAGTIATAMWHDLVNVLMVPAAPVVAVGLLTVAFAVIARRRSAASAPTSAPVWRGSLAALLLSGGITYLATSALFPVATLWGTFEHASGPLLVGLAVAAVVGGDAFVAWLVRVRGWQRSNAWMAPAALVALMLPIAMLQMGSAARQATATAATMNSLPAQVMGALHHAGVPHGSPIITDRPVWVADALLMPAIVLPDEPVDSVLDLAARFGAQAVVVFDRRGDYPAAMRSGPGAACFAEVTLSQNDAQAVASGASMVASFVIRPDCGT